MLREAHATGAADPRHLPGPPADRQSRSAGPSSATRAASRSGCSASAGPTPPRATRCSARCPPRAAACSGTTTSSPSSPPTRPCSPRPRPDEVQAVRYAPPMWGVQLHPEVDAEVLRPWAEEDRGSHETRGIDTDALLRDIAAARDELDDAWRPLAAGFAALARGARPGASTAMMRPATSKGNLLRLGFLDPDAALAALGLLGDAAEPLLALLARTADPDAAIAGLVRLPRGRSTTRHVLLRGAGRRRGHRDAAAERARRERGAGRPPGPPPRALARAHRPRARLDPARGLGGARRAAAAWRPTRRPAPTATSRRRGRRRAAGGVPPPAAPARRPRPDPPPRRRRRRRRALRPGRRHPRGGARDRPAAGRRGRRAGPARR